MTFAFSHLGVCVSDLDRSLRFYCDGLGFERVRSHEVGGEFAKLMELDGVALRSCFIRRDGVSVELLHFDSPGHVGNRTRRPMNELGLTHLSFRVDDLDEAEAAVTANGGAVIGGTRTTLGDALAPLDFVYCTDPDGVRIELMSIPD